MHTVSSYLISYLSTELSSPTLPQIYHPNVDLEGNVCLNILREDWKPVLNLNSVMVGLQYLFLEPNADDPLNKGPYAYSEHQWFSSHIISWLYRGGRGVA